MCGHMGLLDIIMETSTNFIARMMAIANSICKMHMQKQRRRSASR